LTKLHTIAHGNSANKITMLANHEESSKGDVQSTDDCACSQNLATREAQNFLENNDS